MDENLIQGLVAGDALAYREIYERFSPALYRFAVRLLGRHQDAEDALQETFVALVRYRDRLEQVTNLRAYLFATLRNATTRIHRSRQCSAPVDIADVDPPAAGSQDDMETSERLLTLVRRLPTRLRDVLTLKIQGELTFRDIGAICGVSPNTAASRYRYALEKLKQMKEDQS